MIIAGVCNELIDGMMIVDCWLRQLGDNLVGALITRSRDLVSYNVVMFTGYSRGGGAVVNGIVRAVVDASCRAVFQVQLHYIVLKQFFL